MKQLVCLFSLAVLLISCLLLGSCGDNSRATALLSRADSLMADRPDSALQILDGCEAEVAAWPESQQMRHRLLQAKARNKSYVPFTSDSVMIDVVDYYDCHGTANEQMEAHYLLGCVYRDLGEAPKALSAYHDAVECADTLSVSCDFRTLMSIYGQMAELYHKQNLPVDEILSRRMCSRYASILNDTLISIRAYELLLKPYFLLGDTDKVIEIIDSARQMYFNIGCRQQANDGCCTLAHIYLKRGQLGKAKEMLSLFEARAGLIDIYGNISPGREIYYYVKGNYYMSTHKFDSAEYYFRKLSPTPLKVDEYRGLFSLFEQKGIPDSTIKYARLYEAAIDSQSVERRTEAIKNMTSLFNYHRYQHQAEAESLAAAQSRIRYQSLVAILLLIIMLSVFYYKRYRNRKLQEFVMLSSNYDRTKEELARIKQQHENAMQEKSEELRILSESVASYESRFKLLSYHERKSAFANSDIVKTLREKTNWHKDQVLPTAVEWDTLLRLFAQNMSSTYEAIGGRSVLSLLELRTCILVLLGFSNKDLTILFNISQQRITNLKEIINNKLFGEKTATTLVKNLKNITLLSKV